MIYRPSSVTRLGCMPWVVGRCMLPLCEVASCTLMAILGFGLYKERESLHFARRVRFCLSRVVRGNLLSLVGCSWPACDRFSSRIDPLPETPRSVVKALTIRIVHTSRGRPYRVDWVAFEAPTFSSRWLYRAISWFWKVFVPSTRPSNFQNSVQTRTNPVCVPILLYSPTCVFFIFCRASATASFCGR